MPACHPQLSWHQPNVANEHITIHYYSITIFVYEFCNVPYKRNIWQTLYLANEGKNRIGERLNNQPFNKLLRI